MRVRARVRACPRAHVYLVPVGRVCARFVKRGVAAAAPALNSQPPSTFPRAFPSLTHAAQVQSVSMGARPHARAPSHTQDGSCQAGRWGDGHLRYENLDFEILSERPRMYYFPHFLSDGECDRIRELGLPNLKPSKTDAGLAEKVRSSTSYFFSQEQERASPDIMAVKHRAEAISRITLEYQEELQIQHYKAPRQGGQQKDFYIPHFDWIPSRPRVATLLIYLEAPEEGGETIFPLVRHNSSNRNAQLFTREQAEPLTLNMWNAGACTAPEDETSWLRVRPKKGAAVLFYSLLPGACVPHKPRGETPAFEKISPYKLSAD